MSPEVEGEEAVGEAAMAMAARLEREEEMVGDARRMKAESSGGETSQQGGGRIWSGHSKRPPVFKYQGLYNGRIQNQRPDPIRPEIVRRRARREW